MSGRIALAWLVLVSGCNLTSISGKGTGDVTSASGTSANGSGAGSTGSSAGLTSSASGNGTGIGSGTGASSTTGGSRGTSGTSGGSSTGGYTGDAGPCLSFGTICESNAACCTGSCNGTCGQPTGQGCLSGVDCSSGNCTNDVCACSTSLEDTGCATDADCCNGVSCDHEIYPPKQYGRCCSQVGGVCQSTLDCCNENCDDGGHCACLPQGLSQRGPGECLVDSDCCTGKCVSEGGFGNYCLNGPGGQCDGGADCYTNACIDSSCGNCSAANGFCSSGQACCAGLVCATSFQDLEQNGPQHELVDAGSNCCGPAGATCQDAGDCCSATCTEGSCVCAKTAERCFGGQASAPVTNDQSCCSGGACMLPLQANDEFGFPICCQATGQFCISDADCCTESCVNQQCACVAAGGQCGPAGLVAPAGPQACCSESCSDAGACL